MPLTPVDNDPFAQGKFVPVDHDPFSGPENNVRPVTKLDSLEQGLIDPLNGIAQGMLHLGQHLPDSLSPDGLKGADKFFDQKLQSQEAAYQAGRTAAGRDGIDWSRMAGNLVGTSPVMALMPTGAGGFLSRLGAGMVSGGANAALQPVTEDGDYWNNKAGQVGSAIALGGATSPAVAGISRVVSPAVSANVQKLLDEGVSPTPGQILGGGWARTEDKLTSIPGLGDLIKKAQGRSLDEFNTAALSRAVAPFGGEAPSSIGNEGMQQIKSQLSDEYGRILPNLTFKADNQFANEMGNLSNLAMNLPEKQANQFQDILRNQVVGKLSPQGVMDGQTFKGVESELNRMARGYSSDSSFENRQLGDALKTALSSMRDGLTRSNPDFAPQLQAVNQGYANYNILRGAASALGADQGVFTPSQLQNAVKSADRSVKKGNFALGDALMQDLSSAGKSVLSSKYPDSGTAGREALGLVLGAGLEGGGAALGHYALPIAAAGMASLPYTQTGQKLAAALLAKRPDIAAPIGNLISKTGKYVAGGVSPLAFPLYEGTN